MSYDKYRNWEKQSFAHDELKLQVTKDLEETRDITDKLEILDSFQAYVERQHQKELAEALALLVIDKAIRPLLVEFVKSRMPGSYPISRPRMVKQ